MSSNTGSLRIPASPVLESSRCSAEMEVAGGVPALKGLQNVSHEVPGVNARGKVASVDALKTHLALFGLNVEAGLALLGLSVEALLPLLGLSGSLACGCGCPARGN